MTTGLSVKPKTEIRKRVLTGRIEEILKTIHFYRYVTASDITNLLYSPKSLTYVRGLLSELAGNEDEKPREYLCRFRLPGHPGGCRVYTLGSKGRDFLSHELGMPVDWYFRPYKAGRLSYSQVLHNLTLTRFLVAAALFGRRQHQFRLIQTRPCYELGWAHSAMHLSEREKGETKVSVVPDAWLLFQRSEDNKRFPVLLEIDRGTAHQQKFRQHVASRIEFVRSGAYEARFGLSAVIIAYATTGAVPAYRETRRQAMCAWTKDVLTELKKENWCRVFRIGSLDFENLYTAPLFDEPVWYRPDMDTPVPLLL